MQFYGFTQSFYDFKEPEAVLLGAVVHHGEGALLELSAAEEAEARRASLPHLVPIAVATFITAPLLLLLRHVPGQRLEEVGVSRRDVM